MVSFCIICGYAEDACTCGVHQILHNEDSNTHDLLVDHHYSFDLAKQQTHCHGCYEFILKGCVRVQHGLLCGDHHHHHQQPHYYHVPCWLANSRDRPKWKRLSHYLGFYRLDPVLQQKIKRASATSAKDIRRCGDPSGITMSPPKPPPKQCMAIKADGTRCKVRTSSTTPPSKAAAASLREDGTWTCRYHDGYMIPASEMEEEEAQYQHAKKVQRKQYEAVMAQRRMYRRKRKHDQV